MSTEVRTLDYAERGNVIVTANSAALADLAASLFQTTIDESKAAGHEALIALSGGSTPKAMGALLAIDPLKGRVQWDNLQVFWGDERWVPIADAESNAGEAKRGFLDDAPIPADHVHPFMTEGTTPAKSAEAMEAELRSLQPDVDVPVFDLIFLGMGDDGHTASLFPGTPAIHEELKLVVANEVPKLDTTRLTFTPSLLNAARKVVFLVGGAGKAEMLARVLDGPVDVDVTPCQVVRPTDGHLTWIVDEAAATNLAKQ